MKSKTLNTLGYTGIVTLSRYINNKKTTLRQIHNTGGMPLFNFLAECLLGNFDTASLSIPNKIRLLKFDSNSKTFSSKSGFIYLRTKPEKNVDTGLQSGVTYSFIIPGELVQSGFSHIGLYAKNVNDSIDDINKYAALCEVGLGEGTLSMTSALIVDWQLVVSNQISHAE